MISDSEKQKKKKKLISLESAMRLSRSPRCRSLRCSLSPRRPQCPSFAPSATRGGERARSSQNDGESDPSSPISSSLWPDQLLATSLSGAALGPLCDSLHSRFGVLRYERPLHLVGGGGLLDLETTWWTPLLFALAGAIIGAGLPFLDEKVSASASASASASTPSSPPPSLAGDLDRGWPLTLLSISSFVLIYFLSAVGGERGRAPEWLPPSLWLCSLSLFALADATPQGLAVAAATALGGPGVELFLIRVLHLYRYADESFLGAFPAWIAAVYFAGGPAVGALGRRVRAELARKKAM